MGLVGTGSSQHVPELGAMLLAEAGLDARPSGSQEFARTLTRLDQRDAVILISHTGRTSFAVAAREAALTAGALVVSITGIAGGWPEAIETVPMERSQTYSVSVTSALMVLFRVADELGVRGFSREALNGATERIREIVEAFEVRPVDPPARALILVGSGAAAVSAREGALKLREAARVLAKGYESECLLHGCAVPLREGDTMILVGAGADRGGLVPALGAAARAEGLTVASVDEPSIGHPILAQLPIIVRLQLLAVHYSRIRSTDPDRAIAGHWDDEALWSIGRPGPKAD